MVAISCVCLIQEYDPQGQGSKSHPQHMVG